MYFSDELYLVEETRKQDELKQFKTIRSEYMVSCDLNSVSAKEKSSAGVNGYKVEARADVHVEDYGGQKIVRCPEGTPLITPGYYDVYRSYLKGDIIELYLVEREGIR